MKKRLISILILSLLVQFSVQAKKSHKASKGHKKHKTHVTHITQPTVTLNEIDLKDSVWGIDVSHHQSAINWEKLGEQKPNFMFIKASEGVTCQDERYCENYNEAKKLGILVGSYHFFSYKTSGKDQATNFLSVAQHKSGDLFPVLDAEFRKKMPKKDFVTKELTDFINAVYESLGYYPIIYCNYNFYKLYLKEHLPINCKLWIVDYKEKPECDWTFWQSTDRLKIAGISGFVDLNKFNGSTLNLKSFILKDLSL